MLPAIAVSAAEAAHAFVEEGLPPLMIRAFGCCICQQRHYEGDPLFNAHLASQSKHGVTLAPYWHAVWDRYLDRETQGAKQCGN